MKESGEAIERLLHGLRDAEPAPGFEQSIFAAVRRAEETQSAAARPRRLLRGPVWPVWRVACFLLATLAFTVGVASFVTGIRPRQRQIERSRSQTAAVVLPSASPIRVAPKAVARASRPLTAVRRNAVKTNGMAAEPSTRSNVPTPPLPLTEQEKLLLRVARGRDAGNLAVLNADRRNAQTARATQQFQRFFAMNPDEMRTQLE